MTVIAHISDLHVSKSDFDEEVLDKDIALAKQSVKDVCEIYGI